MTPQSLTPIPFRSIFMTSSMDTVAIVFGIVVIALIVVAFILIWKFRVAPRVQWGKFGLDFHVLPKPSDDGLEEASAPVPDPKPREGTSRPCLRRLLGAAGRDSS